MFSEGQLSTQDIIPETAEAASETLELAVDERVRSISAAAEQCRLLESRLFSLERGAQMVETALASLKAISGLLDDTNILISKCGLADSPAARRAAHLIYGEFCRQIDMFVLDAAFDGHNLLQGDRLNVFLDDGHINNLELIGETISAEGLGLVDEVDAADGPMNIVRATRTVDDAQVKVTFFSSRLEAKFKLLQLRITFMETVQNSLVRRASKLTGSNSASKTLDVMAWDLRKNILELGGKLEGQNVIASASGEGEVVLGDVSISRLLRRLDDNCTRTDDGCVAEGVVGDEAQSMAVDLDLHQVGEEQIASGAAYESELDVGKLERELEGIISGAADCHEMSKLPVRAVAEGPSEAAAVRLDVYCANIAKVLLPKPFNEGLGASKDGSGSCARALLGLPPLYVRKKMRDNWEKSYFLRQSTRSFFKDFGDLVRVSVDAQPDDKESILLRWADTDFGKLFWLLNGAQAER